MAENLRNLANFFLSLRILYLTLFLSPPLGELSPQWLRGHTALVVAIRILVLYQLFLFNNLHSRIKEMLRKFRGVASKYLNRYLALFTIIASFAKNTAAESSDILRRSLSAMREHVTYASSQSTGLLEI